MLTVRDSRHAETTKSFRFSPKRCAGWPPLAKFPWAFSRGGGVSEHAGWEGARYWAFISYSHKDASFGRRLHRRLESYALPRRLIGRMTVRGRVPKRLLPIFRDREELSAANDLSVEVRTALQVSRSLVVVCSPAAGASMWVSREVELFRSLHPNRPILAALVNGEPADSFPEVLRRAGHNGAPVEPLAADFRRGRDGAQLGLLKLIAGIVGIGLDELIQRDAQRRTRRVTAVTAAALAAMLVMGVLTTFALNARTEAEHQRGEAEGLVEFMLTDLRDRLKGVGRLDALTAVNQRALRYYGDQDLKRLPADSLERRARILHAMGEDDETRGDHNAALAKFDEARRTTAALLAIVPDDPERIFDQAQSEFWFGYVDYEQHESIKARRAFLAYKQLTDRLIVIAPNNPKYLREAGYADGNLCSLALREPVDPAAAVRLCGSALADMKKAARHLNPESGIADDIVNRHAWMADAYLAAGDAARARAERLEEEQILDGQIAHDPKNMHLKSVWVALQIALARLDEAANRTTEARSRLTNTLPTLVAMIHFDPTNEAWRAQRVWIDTELSKLK